MMAANKKGGSRQKAGFRPFPPAFLRLHRTMRRYERMIRKEDKTKKYHAAAILCYTDNNINRHNLP